MPTRQAPANARALPAPVVLLAQSEAGYMNLMKLNWSSTSAKAANFRR